jgi:hypothetical protein
MWNAVEEKSGLPQRAPSSRRKKTEEEEKDLTQKRAEA